jgi:lysophospholipase L1-like esterase
MLFIGLFDMTSDTFVNLKFEYSSDGVNLSNRKYIALADRIFDSRTSLLS